MSDRFKITCSIPMRPEEVRLSGDILFMREDGLYHLPAGSRVTVPMPMWEKLTVEQSSGDSTEQRAKDKRSI
jgi:hypothetical protein